MIGSQDLKRDWSSGFRLLQLQLDYNDDLVRQVATSLRHQRVIDFYLDDPIVYLKNFAEYGWDEESDELAEEYIEKYVEEIKLQRRRFIRPCRWFGRQGEPSYGIA